MDAEDFLPDAGLDAIEAQLAKADHPEFSMGHVQAYATGTVVVTLKFLPPRDIMDSHERVEAILNLAMCADTLVKNLGASRAALRMLWEEFDELMSDEASSLARTALGLREFEAS